MRVLMLAQFYPPIIGGEEQHVRNLSIDLAKRGHDVAVATIAQGNSPEYEIDNGVRIYRLRPSTRRLKWLYTTSLWHAPSLPDPELVIGLRHIVRRERPHIVHAHNWLVHAFLPLKSWSDAKLIVTLHDYSLVCVQKRLMQGGTRACQGPGFSKCLSCAATYYGPVKSFPIVAANRLMDPIERRAVDMFLAVSHAVAVGNQLQRRRLPFRVIPNFVPDDVVMPHDEAGATAYQTQLPAEGYLLYVGALTRDKGVDVLMRAYTRLAESATPPPLVLIGSDTREAASLMQNPAESVMFLRNWPHHAVMQAWRRSAIALVPSLCADACPTVAMEAMAAGRPVIGSRIGGLPDLVVDGETGFLVPPGDVAALQRAIECLLSNGKLREAMGQAARQRVMGFQASAVVPRIEQIYEEVFVGGASVEQPCVDEWKAVIPESL